MYKLITGFVVLGFIFSLIDAVWVGAGGPVTTRLTASLSAVGTTVEVADTEGFLVSDSVRLQDEIIAYNGKTDDTLTNCTRGYDGTTAVAHANGTKVYGGATDWINAGLGFNIVSTGASVGEINIMTTVTRFLWTTVPKMVSWNYVFLKEGLWQYLRMFLATASVGFIVYLGFQMAMALGGLMQSIFNR